MDSAYQVQCNRLSPSFPISCHLSFYSSIGSRLKLCAFELYYLFAAAVLCVVERELGL